MPDNITRLDKIKCTGCFACLGVCPKNCINIKEDQEGFLCPEIDEKTCIHCGKCVSSCPQLSQVLLNIPQRVLAVQLLDKAKLAECASGGMGEILAETAIRGGGVVYGCIYDENLIARHARVTALEAIKELNSSKYVQSNFTAVYHTLTDDVLSGKPVVIIGTPCQIAAVKNYLGKDFVNVLFVDLICHGVPSPKLFSDYLQWKGSKMGGKILKYNFRDKSVWKWGTTYKAITATATSTATATRDPYYNSFLYAESYRECCYTCCYANLKRVGDITIGDFWGVQDQYPNEDIDYSEGVSVALTNTAKGFKALEKLYTKVWNIESDIEKVKAKNPNLYTPAKRPTIRDDYYVLEEKYGFVWVNKHMYCTKSYYINRLKQLIPKKLKQQIRKVMKKL